MTDTDITESVSGSCLCGSVRFRVSGPFQQMNHCHCSRCRKAHGASFATYVAGTGLAWEHGVELVRTFRAGAGMARCFCARCGSVLPDPDTPEGPAWVPAGTLLEDCGARPVAHIFADSRAAWTRLDDGLPAFGAAPPGYAAPEFPASPAAAADGTLTGGCLCGGIRYRLHDAPLVIVNCHCSRCRRARSAAHATNLFVLPEQLEWIAGEDRVQVYDLPGAERFGANFCPDCGGPVPRSSPKIGRVNVPAGSLDGDPGIGPAFHIYVASKAPWFEIHDDLPVHAERAPS